MRSHVRPSRRCGLATGEARLQRWWDLFDDPTLIRLIEQARTANPNVRLAVARVLESRVAAGVVAGDRLPVIDATPGASVSLTSHATLPAGIDPAVDTLVSGRADLSWNVDLFGRITRSLKAALADYDAAVEDARDVLVSLSAEMALSYVDARTLQEPTSGYARQCPLAAGEPAVDAGPVRRRTDFAGRCRPGGIEPVQYAVPNSVPRTRLDRGTQPDRHPAGRDARCRSRRPQCRWTYSRSPRARHRRGSRPTSSGSVATFGVRSGTLRRRPCG